MIDLESPGETETRVLEVLEDAGGFVHFEIIMRFVVGDATIRAHEVLEDLKSRGVVTSDGGNRWRIRKQPKVVMSLGGDPNFRRVE